MTDKTELRQRAWTFFDNLDGPLRAAFERLNDNDKSEAVDQLEDALSTIPEGPSMTQVSNLPEELVEHMVSRFLAWKLPESFNPDNGISAVRPNYAPNVKWEPSGTNLFDYTQAGEMVRHMIEGLPPCSIIPAQDALVAECREALLPFAKIGFKGSIWEAELEPDDSIVHFNVADGSKITLGDFRKARALLAKLPAPPVVVEGS